jgi:hypothetical protein
MEVHLDHVGVGCNRVVNAASWGPSGLVAFGAHHAVALYDPKVSELSLNPCSGIWFKNPHLPLCPEVRHRRCGYTGGVMKKVN